MPTAEQIQNDYIDYILTAGEQPKSVYVFAKQLQMSEQEFYDIYSSFAAIEKGIWASLTARTINEIQQQEVWNTYSSREKMLAFFYAYIELLKSKRSFIVYSLKKNTSRFSTPEVLADTKKIFESFAEMLIHSGLASGELAKRKYFDKRYKDALWLQFAFIVNFWVNDNSAGFEKTDEAIERGINVTFDLFEQSPLDNLFEYGKFVARNGNIKEKMRF